MTSLTPFEHQILEMFITGDDEIFSLLRQQISVAEVKSREMTGVGFYTEFKVPPDARKIPNGSSFKLSDVFGTADNLEHGFGFVLFVTDGTIEMLEGYTFDEPWPEEVRGASFHYLGGSTRDMDDVKRTLHGQPAA